MSVLALSMFFAMNAAGAELPRFDINSYCQQAARSSDDPQQMFDFCFDLEQSVYDELKAGWPDVPTDIQDRCVDIAGRSGANYRILALCVQEATKDIVVPENRTFIY